MLKKVLFAAVALCCILFSGCATTSAYERYVSDLREDILVGENGDLILTAEYGFRESPFVADGKIGERVYGLTFRLNVVPDEIKRTVKFVKDNKEYSADFAYDAVSGTYKAYAETGAGCESSLSGTLFCGSESLNFELRSEKPENCLSHKDALIALERNQKNLLDAYTSDGIFNAELYVKIFIKSGKPYWYMAIVGDSKSLKACLIDGVSGEVLAVRDVIN